MENMNTARPSKGKTATRKTPDAPNARGKKPEPATPATTEKKRGRGHPKDSPDVWTPEHIAEVADAMWQYIEDTPCPTLPEFCYKNLVRRQRVYEIPELLELKEYLHAKQAAYLFREGCSLTREDGPRGAFLIRALANVGEYSLTEKTETTEHVETTHIYLPDNGRNDGPKPDEKKGK